VGDRFSRKNDRPLKSEHKCGAEMAGFEDEDDDEYEYGLFGQAFLV
jgi:hypothetical protein